MTVVSLVDYLPLPRYDATPWTKANIYESDAADGAYTLIETVILSPVEPDPADPLVRSFTTELATLTNGWYKVIFEDATGDTSETEPVQNVPPEDQPFLPSIADVGAILRARTKSSTGEELGTFTSTTRPTGDQVVRLINDAAKDVTGEIDYDFSPELYPEAASVIALGAALMVELSYFPEQVASGRSPWEQLKAMYDARLARLATAAVREAAEDETGDETAAGAVSYSFPPVTNYLDKVM